MATGQLPDSSRWCETATATNPILKAGLKFIAAGILVPPYNLIAGNSMTRMSDLASEKIQGKK